MDRFATQNTNKNLTILKNGPKFQNWIKGAQEKIPAKSVESGVQNAVQKM